MSQLETQTDASTSTAQPADDDTNERLRTPPPPPIPSTDPTLLNAKPTDGEVISPRLIPHDDIFKIPPLTALKLLSAEVEALVNMTGDIPPTPPPTSPTMPNMRGMQAEKESIVRSHSERSLTRLREQAMAGKSSPLRGRSPHKSPGKSPGKAPEGSPRKSPSGQATIEQASPAAQPIDGVHLRSSTSRPPASPRPDLHIETSREPYIVIGDNSQPLNLQHSAITRKFYSRAPPPISISDYLLRIHRFCPMSTAVYLATSLYIHRLAVLERAIAVTKRNVHRLLLAGLRVAMKALEDLSYPHSKFAKVGGVSEAELARLEISFCFLAGFELVVDAQALGDQWEMLRKGREGWAALSHKGGGIGVLKLDRRPRGG